MKVTINSGKILKSGKVEFHYTEQTSPDRKPANRTSEQDDPPHPDLVKAMKSLTMHAVLLNEFVPLADVPDLKKIPSALIKDFTVTGFTGVSSGDNEGVILSANKKLSNGKIFGFNTAVLRFGDISDNAYPFIDELSKSIKKLQDEFTQYLNGKYGEAAQQKLELKEPE